MTESTRAGGESCPSLAFGSTAGANEDHNSFTCSTLSVWGEKGQRLGSVIRQCAAIYTQLHTLREHLPASLHVDKVLEGKTPVIHYSKGEHPPDFLNEEEKDAVRRLVYGMEEKRSLLNALVDQLYFENSGTVLREDRDLYAALFYVILFRLDDVGIAAFRSMAKRVHEDPGKVRIFLNFCTDDLSQQSTMLKTILCHIDVQYTQNRIMAKLKKHHRRFESLKSSLRRKEDVYAKTLEDQMKPENPTFERSSGRHTVPKPFDLSSSKERPPLVQAPPFRLERIFARPKASKASERQGEQEEDGHSRKVHQSLRRRRPRKPEQAQRENRIRSDPFVFESERRLLRKQMQMLQNQSTHEEVQTTAKNNTKPNEDNLAEAEFEPNENIEAHQMRLNRASVLREDFLIRQKQKIEAELICAFEKELHDQSEFDEWKIRCEEMDEERRRVQVLERKADYQRQKLALAESKHHHLMQKKHAAKDLVQRHNILFSERYRDDEIDLELRQRRVHNVRSTEMNGVLAKMDIAAGNMEAAKEVRYEKYQLKMQRIALKEEEQKRKRALVRAIQVMEATTKARWKNRTHDFDHTKTAGYMLLSEIPYAEADERLMLNESMNKLEMQAKRTAIAKTRERQAKLLADKTRAILRVRKKKTKLDLERRTQRRLEQQQTAQAAQERHERYTVTASERMAAAIRARHEHIAALQYETEQKLHETLFLNGASDAVKERMMDAGEGAAERQLLARQDERLLSNKRSISIKAQAHVERCRRREEAIQEKRKIYRAVDKKLSGGKDRNQILRLLEKRQRWIKAQRIHQREKDAILNRLASRPYSAAITEREKKAAREFVSAPAEGTSNKCVCS